MSTFSADQIVGKTLFARYSIPLKRMPSDSADTVFTVSVGDPVGRVYSWIGGNESALWWMFYDNQKRTYYAKHESGAFDVDSIRDQGALDVKEQREKEKESEGDLFPPNPFSELGATVKTGIIVVFGAIAASFILRR